MAVYRCINGSLALDHKVYKLTESKVWRFITSAFVEKSDIQWGCILVYVHDEHIFNYCQESRHFIMEESRLTVC